LVWSHKFACFRVRLLYTVVKWRRWQFHHFLAELLSRNLAIVLVYFYADCRITMLFCCAQCHTTAHKRIENNPARIPTNQPAYLYIGTRRRVPVLMRLRFRRTAWENART